MVKRILDEVEHRPDKISHKIPGKEIEFFQATNYG